MITDSTQIVENDLLTCDVCIVGGGAAGITLSLELARFGMSIFLLESGGIEGSAESQELLRGSVVNPGNHSPLHEARCRQLGGTTAIWGGRCIPFDGIDFEKRDYVPGSGWPFDLDELEPYYRIANRYCDCGEYNYLATQSLQCPQRHIIEGFEDGLVSDGKIERWSLPTDFGKRYRDELKSFPNLRVILNATCVGISLNKEGDRASVLRFRSPRGAFSVTGRAVVLAAGGLEVTRLLLISNDVQNSGIGNHSGLLGRYYMGHISGSICRVKFYGDPDKTIYQFERDRDGIYCRRRFWATEKAQKESRILNTVLWLDNPPMADPSHKNGVLSMAYLALSTPGLRERLAPAPIIKAAIGIDGRNKYLAHIGNLIRDMPNVITFVPAFLYKRYICKRRLPGFFLKSKSNIYDLHYHAEQSPNPDSRVMLADERDRYGVPQLYVDFRYSDLDVESVYRAHLLLDKELQKHNCGRLEFKTNNVNDHILSQAWDGIHQIGTTRMSTDMRTGVVNENCRIHGVSNLFIASSSVFPTSGQANPTLTIVALSVRLAEYLKQNIMLI